MSDSPSIESLRKQVDIGLKEIGHKLDILTAAVMTLASVTSVRNIEVDHTFKSWQKHLTKDKS